MVYFIFQWLHGLLFSLANCFKLLFVLQCKLKLISCFCMCVFFTHLDTHWTMFCFFAFWKQKQCLFIDVVFICKYVFHTCISVAISCVYQWWLWIHGMLWNMLFCFFSMFFFVSFSLLSNIFSLALFQNFAFCENICFFVFVTLKKITVFR